MKVSDIKADHFYTDGETVRVVMAKHKISLDCFDLTNNSMVGRQAIQYFARWATCEVRPIWALMGPCNGCGSQKSEFIYTGLSRCPDCGRKQPLGSGRVDNQ